jgi:peptidoglycan/LPS O-acetylase OafA/YrhL
MRNGDWHHMETMRLGRLGKLEAIRGLASVYVVASHSSSLTPLRVVFGHGYAAVIVFFILSGFVIFYSTNRSSNLTFKDYFRRRLRRIYPIFLAALVFTYVTNCIVGHQLVPLHSDNLLGNLFLLQDQNDKAGTWFGVFGGNAPLWSLSYEWWFYMLYFPIITLFPDAPRAQRNSAAFLSFLGVVSYFLMPNQISLFLSYFCTWWIGVELAREFLNRGAISFRQQVPMLVLMSLMTALWAFGYFHWAKQGIRPLPQLYHVASATAALVLGLLWFRLGLRGFNPLFRFFAIFAPISYAMYVLHMPVFNLGRTYFMQNHPVLKYPLILACILGLSYLLEVTCQPIFNKAVDALFARKKSYDSELFPVSSH